MFLLRLVSICFFNCSPIAFLQLLFNFSRFALCSLSCFLFPYFVVGLRFLRFLHFVNVLVVALVLQMMGYYLFYL